MMTCTKCGAELRSEWSVCPFCGRPVNYTPARRKRGNGTGTIKKTATGKYKAIVTVGYYVDESGKLHRRSRTKVFPTKKEAMAGIRDLLAGPKSELKSITLQQLYERWIPTHQASKSTLDCYKAAFRYFGALFPVQVSEIDVDDLQECIDECPHGKRTKENMRAVIGLMYKYGIPRHLIPDQLNLAGFLKVSGDGAAHRAAFTDVQIEQIRRACGVVPFADEILVMIYTGFRPSEFLALRSDDVDLERRTITGGAKTDAGKNRIVTISPKILPAVGRLCSPGGYLAGSGDKPLRLEYFTDKFYTALEQIGIDNPVTGTGASARHFFSPHSCRHTFATLMKRVEGADKDKQELIGHASPEMLRYYQDVDLADLRRITDAI
jgi:site-specific recombinase XerD